MANQIVSWKDLWADVRADVFAEYRDAVVLLNLLAIMAVMRLAFLGLALVHVDPEALKVLEFLHTWSTVVVIATFLYTVLIRSLVIASTAHRRTE
jgi:hypothetical protein